MAEYPTEAAEEGIIAEEDVATEKEMQGELHDATDAEEGGTEAGAELGAEPGEEPPSKPGENREQRFMAIDLPYTDEQGNETIRRVTVPVLKEVKERKYKIVKRKRMVPQQRRSTKETRGTRETEDEIEEEYDACVLVETVTRTVLIRDVDASGNVTEREQDFKEEYLVGKERKFKYIKVEKQKEDGTAYESEELEVESEVEDEKPRKRKRRKKRVLRKHYDSHEEFIGEELEYEWTDEEEGRVREEFSHIEEEEAKEAEEGEREEEIVLEGEEWKAFDELMEEGEEESVREEEVVEKEEIPKETSWEKEQKRQKVSFYKLMKFFRNEIERRKTLMRDLKLFYRLTGTQVKSPGKEFDKNPQKFIDYEAAEVEALTKHLVKVYDQYKDEEQRYKKEICDIKKATKEGLEEYRQLLLELIRDCDSSVMQRLTKGRDLTKTVDDIFKYEESLSKEYVKKAICTMNIEQIKYLLFTEVDQSDVPDEQKQVDPFELDKLIKSLKHFESEALEDRTKLEIEKKKFTRILEDVTCKRRETDYLVRKEEEFLKNKPLIDKNLEEREELFWKLKNYWKEWEKCFQKSLKDDYKQRFPAIYHNQKKMDAKAISFKEMVNNLKRHCPKVLPKKNALPHKKSSPQKMSKTAPKEP